ncbi:hypothetical protein [Maribacter aquivivus]|uniref:hypothetical protein n=1 Tax=Maribacter aquivivus TaxID=228958 RepID=UPI0024917091|nr:hypothetical protein [Maribacter aquivivus]
MHAIRLLRIKDEVPESEKHIVIVQSNQLNDVYKYLIQILVKHSKPILIKSGENGLYINDRIVQVLTKKTIEVNSNYENLTFITLFKDIKVHGERDRFLQLDLAAIDNDPKAKKFYEYGLRVDKENDFNKSNLRTKENFLKHFENEYSPYSELFKTEFKIELKVFLEFIDYLLNTISAQVEKNSKYFKRIDKNLIDVQAYSTILNFSKSLVVKKKELIDEFGKEIEIIIDKLTFNRNEYDEEQLKYNLIARQPIIDFGDNLLISPEILLDSLFINSHYSLLENSKSKEVYKAKYSFEFINRILKVLNKYGYNEAFRELDLYQGKNQLGDLDLVVKNSENHFFIIEAKNHSLPLDVYFHDFESTETRLKSLIQDWEKKVVRRNEHLKKMHSKYGISSNFKYIIVSNEPEILSHFSDLLVLTIRELEYYLSKNDLNISFDYIFKNLYRTNEKKFTIEQIESLSPGLKIKKNKNS